MVAGQWARTWYSPTCRHGMHLQSHRAHRSVGKMVAGQCTPSPSLDGPSLRTHAFCRTPAGQGRQTTAACTVVPADTALEPTASTSPPVRVSGTNHSAGVVSLHCSIQWVRAHASGTGTDRAAGFSAWEARCLAPAVGTVAAVGYE
jgi:hypothetical protein